MAVFIFLQSVTQGYPEKRKSMPVPRTEKYIYHIQLTLTTEIIFRVHDNCYLLAKREK